MSDPELAALRQQRLSQMQNQYVSKLNNTKLIWENLNVHEI